MNEYEGKLVELIQENGKDLVASYDSHNSQDYDFEGMINLKENLGVIGYVLILRSIKNKRENLFVNDLLTVSKDCKKTIEAIIEFNEKVAKELGCRSVAVEGGDTDTKKIYETKGYFFEREFVGVKKL